MNILVFLLRLWQGLSFLGAAWMSVDPSLSKDNPELHPNTAALVASLFMAVVYIGPLWVEVKRRKITTRMPTTRSFTRRRFIIFSRWLLVFFFALITIFYFWYLLYFAGVLSTIAIILLLPPCDRLEFAPRRELAAWLGSDLSGLKFFPNMALFTIFMALGSLANNQFTAVVVYLLLTIGCLLVIPLVLIAKRGWKALLQKPELQPAAIQQPPVEEAPIISDPPPEKYFISTQNLPVPERTSKHKYYNAKASPLKWPLPIGTQCAPLDEPTFNLLIRGFETSWLASKDYDKKRHLHSDPASLIRGLIRNAEADLSLIKNRWVLIGQGKGTKLSWGRHATDEISKLLKKNKKFRSLYQATQWFAETPQEQTFKSFQKIAPHIAEYRAKVNVVKHLKHTLNRLPKPEPKPAPAKVTKPTPKPASKPVPPPLSKPVPIPPPSLLFEKIITPLLAHKTKQESNTIDIPPLVFISYSWDSPEHEKWIVALATKLRENGVDAILDKWDLGPLGKPLPHFMETSIIHAQRVICVMTPNYKRKTENLTGGVGYEYSIITAAIFADDINTSKFIPLFRSGAPSDAIPTVLAGRRYVDMRDDTEFEEKFIHELLRDIHDEPRFKKPAIGKKPKF